ncbi:unnamed protein product [Cylindrotheca closterium]|uniref:Nucleotide-diphospho-sugar transferase domain-containing protein n=1 Tax=Cylindrotheca closterium TaxID=2856 RepID=A0AAD2G728_9STRA|nr:unnamed protein product [Cylindrotheca closterium]
MSCKKLWDSRRRKLCRLALAAIFLLELVIQYMLNSRLESPSSADADGTNEGFQRTQNCPASVLDHKGVYQNPILRGSVWDKVVLITAANNGYYEMLKNWEYLASVQGLQWAIAALDQDIYERLGPSRAFPTNSSFAISNVTSWRETAFNQISCNKLRMVLGILQDCDLDVVFSDPDNVFLKNPFAHDMGQLIQSGDYDYIYEINSAVSNTPRTYVEKGEVTIEGQRFEKFEVAEGNTGFHYLSRKSSWLKKLIKITLEQCASPDNQLDDQVLFWNLLRQNLPYRRCSESKVGASWVYHNAPKKNPERFGDILSICHLDPYFYKVGREAPLSQNQRDMVVFHANYVMGKPNKIKSLKENTWEGQGWHMSRFFG